MTDATLRDLVLKRLQAETQPEDEWSALVLAALALFDDPQRQGDVLPRLDKEARELADTATRAPTRRKQPAGGPGPRDREARPLAARPPVTTPG